MKKIIRILFTIGALVLLSETIKAQLNPLLGQYYNNRYLGNPAMAGADKGYRLNMAYRKQWANIAGSPEVQNFTGTFGGEKVGMGLSVNFDKAGLQKVAKVMGTYAYHLPISDREKLHFGVSLGFLNQRLNISDINGNSNDPLASRYNERKTFINGDFGVAYTSGRWNLEAALPNLKQLFDRNEIELADVNTFYSAVSYMIVLGDGMDAVDIEPKVAYRGVKKLGNIWDFGTQVSFADQQILLTGIYHSTKSASFGLGTNFRKKYLVSVSYTSQTGELSSNTNGSFELNLGIRL